MCLFLYIYQRDTESELYWSSAKVEVFRRGRDEFWIKAGK